MPIYPLRMIDVRDKILLALVFVSLLSLTFAMYGFFLAKSANDTIESWREERNERVAETLRLQEEYKKLLKWYKEKYGYTE